MLRAWMHEHATVPFALRSTTNSYLFEINAIEGYDSWCRSKMISTMTALHCTASDVPEINRISKFILPNYSWPEVFLFFSPLFSFVPLKDHYNSNYYWNREECIACFHAVKILQWSPNAHSLMSSSWSLFFFKDFFFLVPSSQYPFFPFIPTFLVPCTINSAWERSMCSACTQVHSLIEYRVMLSVRTTLVR